MMRVEEGLWDTPRISWRKRFLKYGMRWIRAVASFGVWFVGMTAIVVATGVMVYAFLRSSEYRFIWNTTTVPEGGEPRAGPECHARLVNDTTFDPPFFSDYVVLTNNSLPMHVLINPYIEKLSGRVFNVTLDDGVAPGESGASRLLYEFARVRHAFPHLPWDYHVGTWLSSEDAFCIQGILPPPPITHEQDEL